MSFNVCPFSPFTAAIATGNKWKAPADNVTSLVMIYGLLICTFAEIKRKVSVKLILRNLLHPNEIGFWSYLWRGQGSRNQRKVIKKSQGQFRKRKRRKFPRILNRTIILFFSSTALQQFIFFSTMSQQTFATAWAIGWVLNLCVVQEGELDCLLCNGWHFWGSSINYTIWLFVTASPWRKMLSIIPLETFRNSQHELQMSSP